jgi:hypothetical protein
MIIILRYGLQVLTFADSADNFLETPLPTLTLVPVTHLTRFRI